jgi:transposase
MPTPRKQFAHSLYTNRKRFQPLNKLQRQSIIQDVLNGVQVKVLAERYGCHRNTIRNTIRRWKEQHNFDSRPRPGIKPRLEPRERRLLFRYMRRDPTRTWGDVLLYCEQAFGKKVSRNTVRRALKSLKLGHWRSMKRIYLNKKAIIERNQFWRFWRGREQELCNVGPPLSSQLYPANLYI